MASKWIIEEVSTLDTRRSVDVYRLYVKPLCESSLRSLDTRERYIVINEAMMLLNRLWLLEYAGWRRSGVNAVACLWIAAAGRLELDELVDKWGTLERDQKNLVSKDALHSAIVYCMKILLDVNVEDGFALAECAVRNLGNDELKEPTKSNLLALYKTPCCIVYDAWKLAQGAVRLASPDVDLFHLFDEQLDDVDYSNMKTRLELSRRCNPETETPILIPDSNIEIESSQVPRSNWLFPLEKVTFKKTDSKRRWDCCNFILEMAKEFQFLIKREEVARMVSFGFMISQRFFTLEPTNDHEIEAVGVASLWLAAGGSISLEDIREAAKFVIEEKEGPKFVKGKEVIYHEDILETIVTENDLSIIKEKLIRVVFDVNFKELEECLTEARSELLKTFPNIIEQEMEAIINRTVYRLFVSPCCVCFNSTVILVYVLSVASLEDKKSFAAAAGKKAKLAITNERIAFAFETVSNAALAVGREKVTKADIFNLGSMLDEFWKET